MGRVASFRVQPYWTVIGPVGKPVCLTVYKKGAMEVVRRLAA
jgi:hypothetical protein